MFHRCVSLLIGIFRPGFAEGRIVPEKKSKIDPAPPAGLLRSKSHGLKHAIIRARR